MKLIVQSRTGQEVPSAAQSIELEGNGSYIFHQKTNTSLPADFVGAAVITSDQPVAAVVNMFNSGSSPTTSQYHSYNAFSRGSTKLYLPRVVRKYYGYNSGVTVMNVSDTGATVSIVYYFPVRDPVTKSYNVPAKTALVIYLGDDNSNTTGLPNDPNYPQGQAGSAIVSSNVPVVGIVNEDNRSIGYGVTYNAFLDGDQTNQVFFPQVTARYYGYSSGVQLQNVGTETATGTLTFSMAGRSPISIPFTASSGGSWQVFAPNVPGIGQDFNGAVSVNSSQPIVGIANNSFRADVDSRYGQKYGDSFMTYNGYNLASP